MSTNRKNRICIIIPCYNEAASLPSVAADLRKYLPEAHLLFINDASTDNSKTVLHELADDRTTVIDLPINLGIGGGVQTGLLYAARNRYDCAVKFDGDGQHPASALEDILAPVISGEADLSIGSRFLAENDGFKSTFMRRLGIRIFRVLSTWLTGQTITDSTSGYRAYGRRALLFARAIIRHSTIRSRKRRFCSSGTDCASARFHAGWRPAKTDTPPSIR